MAPLRVAGSGLVLAGNSTVAAASPVPADLIESHAPSADAVQEHSRAADTATEPAPPCAGRLFVPLSVTAHRVREVGDVAVVADDPHEAAPAVAASSKTV